MGVGKDSLNEQTIPTFARLRLGLRQKKAPTKVGAIRIKTVRPKGVP
jgi:hypothetical protein